MKNRENGPAFCRTNLWPLITVCALTALYLFSFFNRFAGLRSGDGEFGGGMVFLAGLRPYRDYFTAGPPLNQLKSALELALFGKLLIVTRTMAVLERILMATILYAWLRRLFSMQAAMVAALVTIIVCTGDRSDPLASYNHDAVFLAMLCGLLACISLDRIRAVNRVLLLAALSGVFGVLSLLTKQTVGAAAVVGVLVFALVAVIRMSGLRQAGAWLCAYVAGLIVPITTVALYLVHLGALRACLDMLFVSGPKAKASHPLLFLSREIMIARANWMWLMLGVIGLTLSGFAVLRATLRSNDVCMSQRQWKLISFGGFLIISVAELLALTPSPSLDDFGKASVYYTFLGTAFLGVTALVLAWKADPQQNRRFQIALFAAVAWASAAGLSLSWPAFEPMTLPGLGLLLAAASDGTRKWGRRFLYLVMAAMLFIQVREKLDQPFSFDHQDEPPVRFETARSDVPALRGMRLAPETVRLIDDTVVAVQERTTPKDTIFTYPEMDIFYSLTGRTHPTWTGSHNLDVVQDSFARAEAVRLLNKPPAIVIYARPSEENMRSDERLWREGHPSGQRSMVTALDRIVSGYQLLGTYQLTPADNVIRVYARPLCAPGSASPCSHS